MSAEIMHYEAECSRYQKGSYSHQNGLNSSHNPKKKLDVSKDLKKATIASVERTYKHPKCKILLFKEVSKHHLAFFFKLENLSN